MNPIDETSYHEFEDTLEAGFIDFEASEFSIENRVVSDLTSFEIPIKFTSAQMTFSES